MSRTLNLATSDYQNGDGGLLTNPFFDISQENGTTPSAVNGYYFADQWAKGYIGMSTCSSYKYAGAVSGAPYDRFKSAGIANITTAKASYSAGEYLLPYVQSVEGIYFLNSGWGTPTPKPVSVVMSFYANWAGTGSLGIQLYGGTRTYVTTFPVTVGNQTVVLTIPGDVGGNWYTGNTGSFVIIPFAVTGTTYQAPTLNAWNVGNYTGHSTATNWSSTTGNQISLYYCNAFIGTIPFKSGTDAGIVDFIFSTKRPFDEELRRCKRYLQYIVTALRTYSTGTETMTGEVNFPVEMRAVPTSTGAGGGISGGFVSGYTFGPDSPQSGYVQMSTSGVGDSYFISYLFRLNARM